MPCDVFQCQTKQRQRVLKVERFIVMRFQQGVFQDLYTYVGLCHLCGSKKIQIYSTLKNTMNLPLRD